MNFCQNGCNMFKPCCAVPIGITGATGPTGATGATGAAGATGATGASDIITIRETLTGNAGSQALVTDTYDGHEHILDFVIPCGVTGPKGDTGPQGIAGVAGVKGDKGDTGPQGPTGTAGPASYSSVAFANYSESTKSGNVEIYTMRAIPGVNNNFLFPNNLEIHIRKTAICEITLCGRISGVTTTNGASFALYDATTNEVFNDLKFELAKGNTPDLCFSETNIVEILGSTVLQLRTNIENENGSNIKFSHLNLILKAYSV